jgi:hypothetical protein
MLTARLAGFGLLMTTLATAHAGDGKLIATAGTTSIEGAAGGGIVPWAVLAGYDSREQTSMSVFSTRVGVDDYRFDAVGVAFGYHDRLEVSAVHQTLDLTALGAEIQQNVFGVKVKLAGDLVFGDWPQVSAGIQYKQLQDPVGANLLGAADDDSGTDLYVAATRVELGALNGYNILWNLTARATKANQTGLLGFGGNNGDSHELMLEGSFAVLLSRRLAVGVEYRQKPDNLGAAREEDWRDVFVAWFPGKQFNVTAAWADLGDIAGAGSQRGFYLSLTGYLW